MPPKSFAIMSYSGFPASSGSASAAYAPPMLPSNAERSKPAGSGAGAAAAPPRRDYN